MLTTFHEGKIQGTGKFDYRSNTEIKKPDVVIDYTHNMRLIDKADMLIIADIADSMITMLVCVRKSVKWYKKLFFHMVDLVMLNA